MKSCDFRRRDICTDFKTTTEKWYPGTVFRYKTNGIHHYSLRVVVWVIVAVFLEELISLFKSLKRPTMTRTTTRGKKLIFHSFYNEKCPCDWIMPFPCFILLWYIIYRNNTAKHMFFLQIWSVIVRVVVVTRTTTRSEKGRIPGGL